MAVAVAGLTVSRMGGGLKSKGDGKGEEGGGSRRGPVENLHLYEVKSCECTGFSGFRRSSGTDCFLTA